MNRVLPPCSRSPLDELALRQIVEAQIAACQDARERAGLRPVAVRTPERILEWLTGLGPLEGDQ
jgi:hypothetical protein